MNIRTIISTIIAVLAYCNFILAGFDTAILDGHPTAQAVYKVLSAIFAFAAWINSHYYNQDFSEIACRYTGAMRAEKKYLNEGTDGEDFYDLPIIYSDNEEEEE